jgi:hypothetical protein
MKVRREKSCPEAGPIAPLSPVRSPEAGRQTQATPDRIVPVKVGPPVIIGLLGLGIPGLGQLCCAQDNKGVFLFGAALLGHWLTGGISTFVLCPISGLDAFTIARAIKNGLVIRKWTFFPGHRHFDYLRPNFIPMLICSFIFVVAVIRLLIFANGGGQD